MTCNIQEMARVSRCRFDRVSVSASAVSGKSNSGSFPVPIDFEILDLGAKLSGRKSLITLVLRAILVIPCIYPLLAGNWSEKSSHVTGSSATQSLGGCVCGASCQRTRNAHGFKQS